MKTFLLQNTDVIKSIHIISVGFQDKNCMKSLKCVRNDAYFKVAVYTFFEQKMFFFRKYVH